MLAQPPATRAEQRWSLASEKDRILRREERPANRYKDHRHPSLRAIGRWVTQTVVSHRSTPLRAFRSCPRGSGLARPRQRPPSSSAPHLLHLALTHTESPFVVRHMPHACVCVHVCSRACRCLSRATLSCSFSHRLRRIKERMPSFRATPVDQLGRVSGLHANLLESDAPQLVGILAVEELQVLPCSHTRGRNAMRTRGRSGAGGATRAWRNDTGMSKG